MMKTWTCLFLITLTNLSACALDAELSEEELLAEEALLAEDEDRAIAEQIAIAGEDAELPELAAHCPSGGIRVFEHAYYEGRSLTFCAGNYPDLRRHSGGLNNGENWNDRISSVQVFNLHWGSGWNLYQHIWYDGRKEFVDRNMSTFNVMNDMISSMTYRQ